MDTVVTGSASQFRLSERQVGWKVEASAPWSRTPTFPKRRAVYTLYTHLSVDHSPQVDNGRTSGA